MRSVCTLLGRLGYSLQSVRKSREGSQHPDRDAQFGHIAATVACQQRQRQPVISVDTKKKELIGDFKNAGREWHPFQGLLAMASRSTRAVETCFWATALST